MSNVHKKNRLEELTQSIALSLGNYQTGETTDYEMSSIHSQTKHRSLHGIWEVIDHRIDGRPYIDIYAEESLGGKKAENLDYTAEYEFTEHNCIKKTTISGIISDTEETVEFRYSITMALSWKLKGKNLTVKPLIGYQTSVINGKTGGVRELPGSAAAIMVEIIWEDGNLTLIDEGDVKTLRKKQNEE